MSRARRGTGEHDGDSGPLPASQPGYREGTALPARHGPDVRTDGGRVVKRSDVLQALKPWPARCTGSGLPAARAGGLRIHREPPPGEYGGDG